MTHSTHDNIISFENSGIYLFSMLQHEIKDKHIICNIIITTRFSTMCDVYLYLM